MLVNKSLKRLAEGRTTIVIAHRLSSILNADYIYLLADGQVIDQGQHQQLMLHSRGYQQLMQKQTKQAEAVE